MEKIILSTHVFEMKAINFVDRHEEIDPIYNSIAYIKSNFVEKRKERDIRFFSSFDFRSRVYLNSLWFCLRINSLSLAVDKYKRMMYYNFSFQLKV